MQPRYWYQWFNKWVMIPLVTLTFCACLPGENDVDPIRIGVIASPIGNLGFIGQSTIDAANLAVAQVNAEGGLLVGRHRRPVELVIRDDENVPDTAVEVARKLIHQDEVIAIIGPQFSHTAIRVATVAENAQIPMITPGATNPEITAGNQYIFRIPSVDTLQGAVLANFAREKLKADKAAILYDAADTYNVGITTFFKEEFDKSGGTIVASESYVTGDTDFHEQLAQIKKAEADVLLLPNFSHDVARQAKQAQQLGITAALIGADSWTREVLTPVPELEGAFFSTYYAPDVKNAQVDSFTTSYLRTYGTEPDAAAALTYDALQLLFQAIVTGKETAPASLRHELSHTTHFSGVTGTLSYAENGDPVRDIVILHIEDKKALFFELIEP